MNRKPQRILISCLCFFIMAFDSPEKFDKDVMYLTSVKFIEIKAKSLGKPNVKELKDTELTLCFSSVGAKGPSCIANVRSGQLLKIKSNARTFTLQSIKLQNNRDDSYAFEEGITPHISVSSNPDVINAGRLLIALKITKGVDHPEIALDSLCKSQDQEKIQSQLPKLTVESHCFDFGATINSGKAHPITLMTIMPRI